MDLGDGAEDSEVTRPLAVGIVHTGADVLQGIHAVARAADAPSVRLPPSNVEPVYWLNPHTVVAEFDHYPHRGRPTPQDQQRRSTLRTERTSLPVRLPGEHLHPQLRRSSWDGPSGRAGSSA
jgi:hypothetical protein